jgi:hypothetical protein
MAELSKTEIRKRMQEWRNLKKLHTAARKKIEKQEKRIKVLEEENKKIPILIKQIETLTVLVEELQEMVFGKKKKKDKEKKDDNDINDGGISRRSKKKRTKKSYSRKIPEEYEITKTKKYRIKKCPDCGDKLKKMTTVKFYEEDIILPNETQKLKEVIRYQVEKGWCSKCRKWHSAIKIPPKKVIIGKNVKLYICYLNILMRLSFEQTQNILRDTFHFKISDGEIGNILDGMSQKWKTEYERIKERLRKGKGVHLDETTWGKMWLWGMTSVNTEDILYLVSKTRGKGNAEELLGNTFKTVRVSDAYAAYKNLKGICQLCWAHPFRYLRTLKNTKTLKKYIKNHCKRAYETFSEIYKELQTYLDEAFDEARRKQQKEKLKEKLDNFCKTNKKDPKKLADIKKLLMERMEEYLTCMDYEGIPCDNNKAERILRHFVIKRKISFGNKSEKGAKAFEINASVLMTYWKKFQNNFFTQIAQLTSAI